MRGAIKSPTGARICSRKRTGNCTLNSVYPSPTGKKDTSPAYSMLPARDSTFMKSVCGCVVCLHHEIFTKLSLRLLRNFASRLDSCGYKGHYTQSIFVSLQRNVRKNKVDVDDVVLSTEIRKSSADELMTSYVT